MSFTPVESLLQQLIAIPSESGSERAIVDDLAARLSDRFDARRIHVDETRDALLCAIGEPRVLLAAHVDTVPGHVEPRADEEFIYGRGACDNKGAAAAMIVAARAAADAGASDFGLLFTVGEETTFDGAIAARRHLDAHGMAPERIVIGEPTGLRTITAQRGIHTVRVRCSGTAEHSSTDAPDSAIHKLVRLLDAFLKNVFPRTTYHVGRIEGGTADNVVAASASATLAFRSMEPDIARQVRCALEATGIPCAIDVLLDLAPVDHTAPPHARNEAAYFTEMAFLPNSLVLGPGSIADAHTANERVSRAELNRAVDLYRGFLPNPNSRP